MKVNIIWIIWIFLILSENMLQDAYYITRKEIPSKGERKHKPT